MGSAASDGTYGHIDFDGNILAGSTFTMSAAAGGSGVLAGTINGCVFSDTGTNTLAGSTDVLGCADYSGNGTNWFRARARDDGLVRRLSGRPRLSAPSTLSGLGNRASSLVPRAALPPVCSDLMGKYKSGIVYFLLGLSARSGHLTTNSG